MKACVLLSAVLIEKLYWWMRWMTRSSWSMLSTMELVQTCSFTSYKTKSLKRWLNWYIQPKVLWMQKTQLLPRRRKKVNDWRMVIYTIQSKVLIQRKPKYGRKGIVMERKQGLLQDDILTILSWILHLIKCQRRSKTIHPWSGSREWKEILVSKIKASTVVFIATKDITQTSAMTWSSRES